MERTNDPIKDAENYYMEKENSPVNTYEATVTLKMCVTCRGYNRDDAKEELRRVAEDMATTLNRIYDIDDNDVDCVIEREV